MLSCTPCSPRNPTRRKSFKLNKWIYTAEIQQWFVLHPTSYLPGHEDFSPSAQRALITCEHTRSIVWLNNFRNKEILEKQIFRRLFLSEAVMSKWYFRGRKFIISKDVISVVKYILIRKEGFSESWVIRKRYIFVYAYIIQF